jgi:probable addiction module antidote protein
VPKKIRDHQDWLIEKLADPKRAASYLNTALEDSPRMFLEALRDVAQAQQMTAIARKAGVTRESLYKATSVNGNPTFDTFVSVIQAVGLKFTFTRSDVRSDSRNNRRGSLGRAKKVNGHSARLRKMGDPEVAHHRSS